MRVTMGTEMISRFTMGRSVFTGGSASGDVGGATLAVFTGADAITRYPLQKFLDAL